MINQETKPVKTWGGFNLAIFKVNLNPLSWRNQSSYNKTYKPPRSTSYCYPPVELTDTTTCKLRIHRLLLSFLLGDKAAFYICSFSGMQETLWDAASCHYFYQCYIQGGIDFIFGNGQSFYEVKAKLFIFVYILT